MATASAIVLWLVPAEPVKSFFREVIRRLAKEYEAASFEPHLTLGRGTVAQLQTIDASAIELPIVGLDCSDQFTKTLFVRFALTPGLAQLRYSLGMAAAGFEPHLSLLYQTLSSATKQQLAASLSLPFSSVTFAAMEAIRCPAEVASRADIESWETVGRKPFA